LFAFAQVSSRAGDSLFTVGPGGSPDSPDVRPVRLVPFRGVAPLADTVFLSWNSNDWRTWVSRWTPATEETVVSGAQAWGVLRLPEGPPTFDDGSAVDVKADPAGEVWVLASVRRRSPEQEMSLREALAESLGPDFMPGMPPVREAPSLKNEVYDGALLHMASEDSLTSGVTFEEYPWGFVDSQHYFTLRETEAGLLQIRIWRFERVCE
jgi:hypothetical protein